MARKTIDALFDRSNLSNINFNFEELFKIVESLKNMSLDLLNDGKLTAEQFKDLQISLNELVKKGDVSVNDINTNLGKIGLSHLSEEVISAITGKANVNLIPEDGSVTTNKVADKAIEPNKTNFFFKSKNLFDNTKVTANKKANGSTGAIETKNGWYVSSMIPVSVGQTYSKNKAAEIVCYNNKSQYVTSYGNSSDSVKMVNDVAYIRLNILFENYIDFQLEANTVSTSYEKFGIFSNDIRVSSTNFENDSIVGEKLTDGSIEKTKTDFVQESNNLFNIENIEYDIMLGLNGSTNPSINYVMSDYIQVDEGETYVTNEKYFGYVIYDRNKHLITGRGQDITGVNIPSGGHYIRLSILNKWLPNFKILNRI